MSAPCFAACAQRWGTFGTREGMHTSRHMPKAYRGLQR